MRLRLLTALICLAALGPRPAWSQTSASAPMTGTVLTAITITGSDLGFGALLSTQSKRVAAPAGGRFVVTMAAATPVTIAYAFPAALGPGVTLSAWELLSNTLNDPASAQAITVSAGPARSPRPPRRATSTSGSAPRSRRPTPGIGSYSQPITLTVTYN